MRPSFPISKRSGTPPTAVLTTGRPEAIASITESGLPSQSELSTKTSIAPNTSGISAAARGNALDFLTRDPLLGLPAVPATRHLRPGSSGRWDWKRDLGRRLSGAARGSSVQRNVPRRRTEHDVLRSPLSHAILSVGSADRHTDPLEYSSGSRGIVESHTGALG